MSDFKEEKFIYGPTAWKLWIFQKNLQIKKESDSPREYFKSELTELTLDELNDSLSLFVKEARNVNGKIYSAGAIYYLCCGIQKYLFDSGSIWRIFSDPHFNKFTKSLDKVLQTRDEICASEGVPRTAFEEEVLWETRQLGSYSHIDLLNTLMYLNTKYFKLKSTDDHARLSLNNILLVFDKSKVNPGRYVPFMRYYPYGRKCQDVECFHSTNECIDCRRKLPNGKAYMDVEAASNENRCLSSLYQFYLKKCPLISGDRIDTYYLQPNPKYFALEEGTVSYLNQPLDREVISKMIQRFKLILEIQEN